MNANFKDIRFIYLPPMICASIQCISVSPESDSLEAVCKLISDYDLINRKPDLRHFGFTPNFYNEGNQNIGAYERWITVPEDLILPGPFVKKNIKGGMYAAHMVPIGNFDETAQLIHQLRGHNGIELLSSDEDSLLEEYLNIFLLMQKGTDVFYKESQIDLLIKIKSRHL